MPVLEAPLGQDLIKKSGLEEQERKSPNTPSAAAADTGTEMSFDLPLLGGQCNEPEAEEEASSDKSSIGKPDDDSDDEDEQVGSTTTLSLASLEDSLPIKKGLSKHYSGKSTSFGDLGEVKSVTDLPKSDNPLNKRRRTLMANELHICRKSRKSSFYSDSNPISVPLLPLLEHQQHDQDDDDHHIDHQHQQQQQHQQQHQHQQPLGLGHDNNTSIY